MGEAAEAVAEIGHNQPPPKTILEILSEKYPDLFKKVEELADRANKGPRKIENDDDLDKVGKLVKDASALFKEIDNFRADEKQPFLDGGRDVDSFFNPSKERVDRIRAAFAKVGADHQRAVVEENRRKAAAEAAAAREEEQKRLAAAEKAQENNRSATATSHLIKADEAAAVARDAEKAAATAAKDIARRTTASGIKAGAKTEWTFEIEDYSKVDLNALRMLIKREDVEKAIRQAVKNGVRDIPGVRIYEDVKATFR